MIRRPTAEWAAPPRLEGRQIAQSLPLEASHGFIIDALSHVKGHTKHSARSALFHLGRAWSIKEVDPEMAVFRCITAEEEAATALFRSVKRLKYPRAGELKERDHTHKNALRVFFDIVTKAVEESTTGAAMSPTIYFESLGSLPAVHFKAPPTLTVNERPAVLAPKPPLNFQLLNQAQEPYDFSFEVQAILAVANVRRMQKELQERANFRNRILYAGPGGVPALDPSNIDVIIKEFRDKTLISIAVLELIDPYRFHQLFVTQCIAAFLKMLSSVGDITPQLEEFDDQD